MRPSFSQDPKPLPSAGLLRGLALAGVLALWGHAQAAIPASVTFRNFFGSLTFDRPLSFAQFPGRDSAYVVVQQSGAIQLVQWREGAWTKSVFDSIAVGGVNGPGTDDGGLVGFAFHPDYLANRKYYVYYVASYSLYARPGRIVFAERRADSTLMKGSGIPQRLLLTLAKPDIYHNGGTLAFGKDRFLYTAIGDGGGSGDPQNRAQNKGVLFGKFLRLDVEGADAYPQDTSRNYAIPPGNPFTDSADAGYLPEIWALGVRSPWKWSFHPVTGEIWLGDIGQSNYEDVSIVRPGGNLGWKIREAAFCFSGSSCASAGLTAPALTLNRAQGLAVTGGRFFTGDSTCAFHGLYVFGDFGKGTVWALREQNGIVTDTQKIGNVNTVNSIDSDAQGRLFAVSMSTGPSTNIAPQSGTIYVLESPDMRLSPRPVGLAPKETAARRKSLSRREFDRHPERYRVYGLDGRETADPLPGLLLVRPREGGALRILGFE
jgi:glucose/arabinose dehydrogenase